MGLEFGLWRNIEKIGGIISKHGRVKKLII